VMGGLYAVNTTGAIVGTLASGFVLIASLGLQATIETAAACNLLAALGALSLSLWERAGVRASACAFPPSP